MARVMVHDVDDDHDRVVLVRHYNGSGSLVHMIEMYVTRDSRFLGRVHVVAGEIAWEGAKEHKNPASPADVTLFLTHCRAMYAMAEKLWKP